MNDTSRPYRVKNPANGEVLETFDFIDDGALTGVIQKAYEAFQAWRDTPVATRASALSRLSALLHDGREALAQTMATEMGKPVKQGISEVEFCTQIFNYFADNACELLKDEPLRTVTHGTAVIQRRPMGVLLGIMPWNYPYYQVARFVAPNILLGNTILLKHSEICPKSALAIGALIADAGIPAGVYQNLFASHEQIERVIADPRVEGVSLTGSRRAASAIGALAGRYIKKSVLELGGSDPYIILDSDDIRSAARSAWRTRMSNTGQACNSNKRMIVMSDIYDAFVDELTRLARRMKPASPGDAGPDTYAPLSSREAAEQLDRQVSRAVQQGAILRAGGQLAADGSAHYAPAVLTDVRKGMAAYEEELFGPVAVIYRVDDDEEAVALANDSEYGLGGAVFSRDTLRATQVADRLEVGMCSVNAASIEGAAVPFGGTKRSGFGRELGPLAMDEFVNKRVHFIAS